MLGKERKQIGGRKMPRTPRLIINGEAGVYHAWDVEPNSPAILRFNHIML
jgi:hypothetical protein